MRIISLGSQNADLVVTVVVNLLYSIRKVLLLDIADDLQHTAF